MKMKTKMSSSVKAMEIVIKMEYDCTMCGRYFDDPQDAEDCCTEVEWT